MVKVRRIIQDYSLLIIFILLAILVIIMAIFLYYAFSGRFELPLEFGGLITIFVAVTLLGIGIAVLGVVRDVSVLKRKDREIVEKDAELQRFAYSVSHDLKSPLVTMKTFLDCLERDVNSAGTGERIDQDLKYIRSSYDRMNILLNELFQLSRLGKRTKTVSVFSYEEILKEAVSLLAGRIAEGRVKISIFPDPILLSGDRSQLLAVWQNLIENAIKYSGEREPYVGVGVQKSREPVFYVTDNGIGIDRDDKKRIFELFTKLDSKSEGTGFGLALVKRIVEVYGGRVWVESPGRGMGSTFKFTLPEAVAK